MNFQSRLKHATTSILGKKHIDEKVTKYYGDKDWRPFDIIFPTLMGKKAINSLRSQAAGINCSYSLLYFTQHLCKNANICILRTYLFVGSNRMTP